MTRYYVYDSSFYGFLTAVFLAYTDSSAYITARPVQLGFDDDSVSVVTEEEKAQRVLKKIRQYDKGAVGEIYALLKSNLLDGAQRAYRYIQVIMRHQTCVRTRLADTDVLNAMEGVRKVWNEVHLMKGLLRFMETENGVMYAPYAPDNDITEYLLPHFVERFPSLSFIIHDTKRNLAGLYNQKDTLTVPLDKSDIFLSKTEEAFCSLWREYYNAVNIPQRKRLRQMRGYMPVRYWSFLPEKRP